MRPSPKMRRRSALTPRRQTSTTKCRFGRGSGLAIKIVRKRDKSQFSREWPWLSFAWCPIVPKPFPSPTLRWRQPSSAKRFAELLRSLDGQVHQIVHLIIRLPRNSKAIGCFFRSPGSFVVPCAAALIASSCICNSSCRLQRST